VPDGCGWDHPIYLAAGRHVLSVRVAGKNSASKGYAFGFDYLKIMPAY
jgi:hypothetical protein